MINKIFKVATLALLSVVILSCSKNDDTPNVTSIPTFEQENYFVGLLSATAYNEKVQIAINEPAYESAIEFTPLFAGSITSLKLQLPAVNNSVLVTLWDKATGTAIKTVIVDVAIATLI